MSLRYDESLNLTPSFKTQNTQLTAVPQKRLFFITPPVLASYFQNYLPKLRKISSFGKVFPKLSAKTEKNIEFWQGIFKIICQNQEKYRVLVRYFQNYLPKSRKIWSFGKLFTKLFAKTKKNIKFWQGILDCIGEIWWKICKFAI